MTLAFDEAAHRYTWNGREVPHVTGILEPLTEASLALIPQNVLAFAAEEGKAIHKMVELDCAGTLDLDTLPGWMEKVYAAWLEFKAHSGFSPILSEHKCYSPMGYAGTLDLLCELPSLTGWKGAVLLDVKRSLFGGPVIGLQLAAYENILRADKAMPRVKRRGALRLNPDGKLRLEPYDDTSDASAFLALLTIHKWKENHGLD